jgi:hypothetical protein
VAVNGQLGKEGSERRIETTIQKWSTLEDERHHRFGEERSSSESDTRILREGSTRKNANTRIHIPSVYAGARGEGTPDYRLQATKPVYGPEALQDGEFGDSDLDITKERLPHQDRFKGCISPHTDSPQIQKISTNSVGRDTIPIQGPTVRTQYSPASIHPSSESSTSSDERARDKDGRILGRHLYSSENGRTSQGAGYTSGHTLAKTRVYHKPEEDLSSSKTETRISRFGSGHQRNDALDSIREIEENKARSVTNIEIRNLANEEVGSNNRSDEFRLQSSEDWKIDDEIYVRRCKEGPATRELLGQQESQDFRRDQRGITMVDRESRTIQRKTIDSTNILQTTVDRRIRHGLGSSLRKESSTGGMVTGRDGANFQPERKLSDPERPGSIYRETTGTCSKDPLGQHDGGIQRGPPGRNTFGSDPETNQEDMGVCSQEQNLVNNSTHQRSGQHTSGSSQPRGFGQRRISPIGTSDAEYQGASGRTIDRSIRFEHEQQMQTIHDEGGRRLQHQLDELGITTNSPTDKINTKDPTEIGRRSSTTSDSSNATVEKFTLFPSNRTDENSTDRINEKRPGDDTKISPLEGRCCLNDSISYLWERYAGKYDDPKCLERLTFFTKDSTEKTYRYIWKKYVDFCKEGKRTVESGKTLVEFIADLDDKKYAASTIRSYAVGISSISMEDPLTNKPIGQDADVDRILGAVKRHGMKYLKDNMMWDLGEALNQLKDMDDSDMTTLTAKTAFLLAIVTFWRPASDMARISFASITFNNTGEEVTLTAIDVKEACQKSTRILKFEDPECCPVITLKKYLNATRHGKIRETSDALFISLDGKKPIKGERISKLIRGLMGALGVDKKYRPHSIRATAPSTALLESMPMQWILGKANWATAETFQKYYKKDFVDRDCTVTNIIQSKLLPQRNEAQLSNTGSILKLSEELRKQLRDPPTHPERQCLKAGDTGGERN